MDETPSLTARCPLHAELASVGVCSRCGTYVCELCTERGRFTDCATCRARSPAVLNQTRDAWSIQALSQHAWLVFKREWATLLPALVLASGISMGLGAALVGAQVVIFGSDVLRSPYALRPNLLGAVIGLPLNLIGAPLFVGSTKLCLDALRGASPRFSQVFGGYSRLRAVAPVALLIWALSVLQILLMGTFFGDRSSPDVAASAVSLVVGLVWIYLGISLSYAYAVLVDDPTASAKQALQRSWAMVRGQHLRIVGMGLYLGVVLTVSAIMCLVPLLAALPWGMLVWCGSYLALSTPTPAQPVR